nr:ribosomal protein S3 [Chlorosarcina stigmatica]
MGQKVHPAGFRVGITKKHQSQWFARFHKNNYSQSVLEDHMLRTTLMNIFPDLLNPASNKIKKRSEDTSSQPKITQIKIERGLIPYEIAIQIHAENCELIKASIDNLKVNRNIICHLQTARQYLTKLGQNLSTRNAQNNLSENLTLSNEESTNSDLKNKTSKSSTKRFGVKKSKTSLSSKGNKPKGSFKPFKRRRRLTKQEYKQRRRLLRRFKKRQLIRRRYRQLMARGLFIQKKGKAVLRKLSVKKFKNAVIRKINKKGNLKSGSTFKGSVKSPMASKLNTNNATMTVLNALREKIKKKFVRIFLQKINKNFLKHLKAIMNYWHDQQEQKSGQMFAPLIFNKKWSLAKLNNFKNKPVAKLLKLIEVLETKSLAKLETLRKQYIAFGSISKTQGFSYYQIITFLKRIKQLVRKMERQQKLTKANSLTTSLDQKKKLKSSTGLIYTSYAKLAKLKEKALRKVLNNVDDECRKIKFIEYLKQIVKKHRTDNIFYYLSTIADARKNLKDIQKFTKKHADFLFGLDSQMLTQSVTDSVDSNTDNNKIKDRIVKVIEQSAKKSDLEKGLQDAFLEQIEKERNICKENIQLTPKISLKFYSVRSKNVNTKASTISLAIIDALEKRKPFRGVIKKSKKDLMKNVRVKGVKIQLSGRLNGAEMARTEWVRAGRVPLQTLRANIDYNYSTANTIYGIIGVKVWIFKGYAKHI